MRIAQIILPGASAYELKSQRIDAAALAGAGHETFRAGIGGPIEADLAHVYGPRELPVGAFLRFPLPYVASGQGGRSRLWFRRPVPPRAVVVPVEPAVPPGRGDSPTHLLPEAVEDHYFARASRVEGEERVIGSFAGGRPQVQSMIDRTRIRIERTRSDIRWEVFADAPSLEELASLDAWVDPAIEASDYDGYVAEAAASGLVVVAARTPMNTARLESGRTGFLVPAGDPNETTHAILTALFKTESAQQKRQAATQTISKFRARQRLRALLALYEMVLGRT